MNTKHLYDFSFKEIDGDALPLSSFKGKVVMVVNTASLCRFTNQYAGLQVLHDAYHEQGLVVLAVPSNDFQNQEPGTNAEILKFCMARFEIRFPVTEKVKVLGDEAHPFFIWADELVDDGRPKWNFHKYLFGRDGELIRTFYPAVHPGDPEVTEAIERVLKF